MKNLYILELSDAYENQIRLPYGTGLIWSYCKSIKEIKTNYSLNWTRENFSGDFYSWAKECLWWGRKGGRYLTSKTISM
jgi:hypothetical protein